MPGQFPDFEQFHKLARQHDIVPVICRLLSDRTSPVMAFEVIGRDEHAVLFESTGHSGRWSCVATRPRAVYQSRGGRAVVWRQGMALEEIATIDPFEDLSRMLGNGRYARSQLHAPFPGGMAGYISYELARNFHRNDSSQTPTDDRGLPDASFGVYDEAIVFDHSNNTLCIIVNVSIDHSKSRDSEMLKSMYESACRRIELLVQRLNQPSMLSTRDVDFKFVSTAATMDSLTREQFEAGVGKCFEQLNSGILQSFSPSIRLRLLSSAQPIDVYRALRAIEPGPFMFVIKLPQCTLIGTSCSLLLDASVGAVDPRQLSPLKSGQNALDVLSASLPNVSVTGSPKDLAMKAIDEIEPFRRGPFGGAVGYFGFDGSSQVCVAQRMIIWRNGSYDAQACVEFTRDSTPANCYERCVSEARALIRVVELAGRK